MNQIDKKFSSQQELNLWAVYGICLLISTVFFLLFGFNSPIYTFNSDHDFQWYMTVGNSLTKGKIPYRDIFEHKGPLVYFVFAFACLFANPGILILILEIICMSLFFFFTYRICKKRLNTFYSLIAIPLLAFAIFTSWCRIRSAAIVEEFALPIYAYFLLCWLEFLTEKKHWNWVRALCLGLCFGVLLWVKYTLFYFMLVPMIVWFILSLRRRQYRTLMINVLCIIAGVLIITAPILFFYALHHAIDDLFYVYFYINLTAYGASNLQSILSAAGLFFIIGPALVILIILGVISFSIKYWREQTGWLLLISFIINFILLTYSANTIAYYYSGLIPYCILGIISILEHINTKLTLQRYRKLIFITLVILCIGITIPFSILTYEWGRNKNEYTPLAIAEVIKNHQISEQKQCTLFCYKIYDFGFYNATNILPNNYFFVNSAFDENRFPKMYESFRASITNQTSDFVITHLSTWNNEKSFLSQYYRPYTNHAETSTYTYDKVKYYSRKTYKFILLIKK